jgi:hypothetical protein
VNSKAKNFVKSQTAQNFAKPIVDFRGDPVKPFLGKYIKGPLFRDEPAGMFIRGSLLFQ